MQIKALTSWVEMCYPKLKIGEKNEFNSNGLL